MKCPKCRQKVEILKHWYENGSENFTYKCPECGVEGFYMVTAKGKNRLLQWLRSKRKGL